MALLMVSTLVTISRLLEDFSVFVGGPETCIFNKHLR